MTTWRMLADMTPSALTRAAAGSVWELVVDPGAVRQLQERYQISAMLQRPDGVQLHVVGPERPTEHARAVEPDLGGPIC